MGEGMQDDRVWVVKAHHPAQQPLTTPFVSKKVICIVRNPVDTFVSFANLVNTMSHTHKPDFSYQQDHPNWWDWWLRTCAENHAQYMATLWKHHVVEKRNPIYFVRYEDLILDKENTLQGLFRFLLEIDSLQGTNIEARIK